MSGAGESGAAVDPEVSEAANAAKMEIARLLEDARSKAAEFTSSVASSTTTMLQEVDKAKTVSSQIENLGRDATSIKSTMDSDQSASADALAKTKASQIEIDGIKTEVATSKGVIETVQKAAIEYQSAAAQSKAEIEKFGADAKAASEKLSAQHEDVNQRISALQVEQASFQSILKELADAKSSAESNRDATRTYLEEVEKTKDHFAGLSSETTGHYDALVARLEPLQGKISEIEDANNKITDLRRRLLESSGDAKSVQDEISDLRANIDTILVEVTRHRDQAASDLAALRQKTEEDASSQSQAWDARFEKLHQTLKEQILALLPSAGAAGLAWTYFDAKSRYAPTPAKPGSDGSITLLNRAFGYNPASLITTIFFYGLFMLPLIALIWGTYDLVRQIEYNHMPMPDYRIIALRFLIAIPLATLSAFGFASLHLYRKLYEQYNHKQRVMELYMSFKREIETNGDDEQKKKLLTIMLDSVAEKAWKFSEAEPEAKEAGGSLGFNEVLDAANKAKAVFLGSS